MDKKQFEIDQLRKDKIIYATEATATSTTAVATLFIFANYLSSLSEIITYLIGLFALGFWLYAMVGNYFRLQKIRKLESKL